MSFNHEMDDMELSFKKPMIKALKKSKQGSGEVSISSTRHQLHLLQRICGMDKSPMVYFESYFHPGTGLLENENFEKLQ
ncbi:MAG: hypothetical protein ABIN89_07640 [Chitinophagaceae bacterium]